MTGVILRGGEYLSRFRIVLPLASCVLFSHETLFAHEKKVQSPTCFTCFAQSEIECSTGATNGTQDCFASNCFSGFVCRAMVWTGIRSNAAASFLIRRS